MLKYFNKEKKKSAIIITSVLPIEEFFARGDTEIGTDFWKMNASQLEEVVKKEEQYIKNLKKLYTQQLDVIAQQHQTSEDEKKQLKTHIEELEMKNQLNIQQKEQMEQQYKTMYEKSQQVQQSVDLLDMNENKDEEITKLKKQCEQVCEEMRRLQEENDDITIALDGEKQHKEKVVNQKQTIIQQLEQQLQQAQGEAAELQTKLTEMESRMQADKETITADLGTKVKELDSKLLQERIKSDQKNRDCVRLEESIVEYKKSIEQLSEASTNQLNRIKLLESKRVKDKKLIIEQKGELQSNRMLWQEQQIKLINESNESQKQLGIMQEKVQQLQQQIDKHQSDNKQELESKVLISKLELSLQDSQSLNINLEKQLQKLEEQMFSQEKEKDAIIKDLTRKRENAKVEIEQLNDKLLQTPQNKASKQTDNPKHLKSHRRIQVFPTIYKCLTEMRQVQQECYKHFIELMLQVTEPKAQEQIVQIEKSLNEVSRRSQDLIDLLQELGLV